MAEAFNIRFTDLYGKELLHVYRSLGAHSFNVRCEYYMAGSVPWEGYSYIHSDCYEMLSPKLGDLITINNGQSASLITHEEFLEEMKRMRPQLEAAPQIIQCHGKAFFMPEVENEK